MISKHHRMIVIARSINGIHLSIISSLIPGNVSKGSVNTYTHIYRMYLSIRNIHESQITRYDVQRHQMPSATTTITSTTTITTITSTTTTTMTSRTNTSLTKGTTTTNCRSTSRPPKSHRHPQTPTNQRFRDK